MPGAERIKPREAHPIEAGNTANLLIITVEVNQNTT